MPSNQLLASGPAQNCPQSLNSNWGLAPGDSGNLNLGSADSNFDLASEIVAARWIEVSIGTLIAVSALYDKNFSSISQNPIIMLAGKDGAGVVKLLKNKGGSTQTTLTTDCGTATDSDLSDGTYRHTAVDLDIQAYDRAGCSAIAVIVVTAIAGTGGTAATSALHLKAI